MKNVTGDERDVPFERTVCACKECVAVLPRPAWLADKIRTGRAQAPAAAGSESTDALTIPAPDHPVSRVEWVAAAPLVPNDYNPNVQPPPEFRLLKVSLLEDGWTQPIVVFDEGPDQPLVIIDGEHRWRVAREDKEVAARTNGLVPICRLRGDRAHRMMATIRHNRARGEHGVKPMAAIVRELLLSGLSADDVGFLLQMELEEVDRLADAAGLPRRVVGEHGDTFAKGWVPG